MRTAHSREAGLREVQQPRRGDRGQTQDAATVHPAGEGEGGVGDVGGVSNGGSENRTQNNNDSVDGQLHPNRSRTGLTTKAKVSPRDRKRNRLTLSLSRRKGALIMLRTRRPSQRRKPQKRLKHSRSFSQVQVKSSYIVLEWALFVFGVAVSAVLWTLALLGKISSWLPRCWWPVTGALYFVHEAVTIEDGAYISPLVHAHGIVGCWIHGGAGLAWIYTASAEFRAGSGWTAWFCFLLFFGGFFGLRALGNVRKPDRGRASIIATEGTKLGDYAVARFAAAFGG